MIFNDKWDQESECFLKKSNNNTFKAVSFENLFLTHGSFQVTTSKSSRSSTDTRGNYKNFFETQNIIHRGHFKKGNGHGGTCESSIFWLNYDQLNDIIVVPKLKWYEQWSAGCVIIMNLISYFK